MDARALEELSGFAGRMERGGPTRPRAVHAEIMYAEMQDLTIGGLVGIQDPEDVPEAVRVIRGACLSIFMVSGDFKPRTIKPRTIKPGEDDSVRALVLTGEDIETLTPEGWNMVVGGYTEIVFARTTPEQVGGFLSIRPRPE